MGNVSGNGRLGAFDEHRGLDALQETWKSRLNRAVRSPAIQMPQHGIMEPAMGHLQKETNISRPLPPTFYDTHVFSVPGGVKRPEHKGRFKPSGLDTLVFLLSGDSDCIKNISLYEKPKRWIIKLGDWPRIITDNDKQRLFWKRPRPRKVIVDTVGSRWEHNRNPTPILRDVVDTVWNTTDNTNSEKISIEFRTDMPGLLEFIFKLKTQKMQDFDITAVVITPSEFSTEDENKIRELEWFRNFGDDVSFRAHNLHSDEIQWHLFDQNQQCNDINWDEDDSFKNQIGWIQTTPRVVTRKEAARKKKRSNIRQSDDKPSGDMPSGDTGTAFLRPVNTSGNHRAFDDNGRDVLEEKWRSRMLGLRENWETRLSNGTENLELPEKTKTRKWQLETSPNYPNVTTIIDTNYFLHLGWNSIHYPKHQGRYKPQGLETLVFTMGSTNCIDKISLVEKPAKWIIQPNVFHVSGVDDWYMMHLFWKRPLPPQIVLDLTAFQKGMHDDLLPVWYETIRKATDHTDNRKTYMSFRISAVDALPYIQALQQKKFKHRAWCTFSDTVYVIGEKQNRGRVAKNTLFAELHGTFMSEEAHKAEVKQALVTQMACEQ